MVAQVGFGYSEFVLVLVTGAWHEGRLGISGPASQNPREEAYWPS